MESLTRMKDNRGAAGSWLPGLHRQTGPRCSKKRQHLNAWGPVLPYALAGRLRGNPCRPELLSRATWGRAVALSARSDSQVDIVIDIREDNRKGVNSTVAATGSCRGLRPTGASGVEVRPVCPGTTRAAMTW